MSPSSPGPGEAGRLFREGKLADALTAANAAVRKTPADIGARADAVVARLRAIDGVVLLFSSAHMLRVLAARWLGQPVDTGRFLVLGTASLSVLGYEHDRSESVIRALTRAPLRRSGRATPRCVDRRGRTRARDPARQG